MSSLKRNLVIGIVFLSIPLASQIDTAHKLNIYDGFGVAIPLGTFSKASTKPGSFGKTKLGLHGRAGVEYFLNPKNALSIDLEFNLFNVSGDSVNQIVARDITTYSSSVIGGSDFQVDVEMFSYTLGYSRLFKWNKLDIQARIGFGIADFSYNYYSAYVLSSTATPISFSSLNTLTYETKEEIGLAVKPDIGIKYIFKKMEKVDWIVGFNVSYFYVNPNVPVYSSRKTSAIGNLQGPVHIVGFNLSIQLVLKKVAFQKFKEWIKHVPLWHYGA